MKSLLRPTLCLLMLLAVLTAGAQERVSQTIYRMAKQTAADTRQDATVRYIAQFRADAVTYLNTQTLYLLTDTARQTTGEEAAHLSQQLDSMAYFMYDYVDLYRKELSRARTDKAKAHVTHIFREASITCPLFNDPDRAYTLAYYNDEEGPTPFSLDTDWVRASATVRQKLRE